MTHRAAEPPLDILLVSTADWDNPFWTNKQHVALELARRGHRVFYVESLGLRRPTVTGRDLTRIFKRLKRGLMPPRRVHDNLWVWSPLVAPLHGSKLVRFANSLSLKLFMGLWLTLLRLKPRLLWTYSPITPNLFDLKSFDLCVYHAVDDIKEQPGMPREAIASAEAVLVKGADIVFVTSLNLLDQHKALNPKTWYFPNVADYDHFNRAMDPDLAVPADILAIPAPRLGLIGAISGYKIDFPLLCAVARARPDWSFILIGEIGEGDPWTDASQMRALPNIHLMGPRAYADLPACLKGMDVAIMASLRNPYTKSMFPMKFFEYLAAGRPVVSLPLEALAEYEDVATFCDGETAFIAGIEAALANGPAGQAKRLERARANTYQSRTDKMMAIVADWLKA